jgi:hypothetical protein
MPRKRLMLTMSDEPPKTYNGNSQIKSDGVQQSFTLHEIQEYQKCMKDPAYFARTYIKVINLNDGLVPFNLYPYQDKMFEHFNNNRFSIVLACRQSGKSVSSIVYLLWYAIFNSEKTIAILANKGATAREMLSRIALAIENLPFFLQPGCKVFNKGSIVFSNNSKIFAAATSSSSVRGQSCVTGDTKICICDENDNIFYVKINDIINKSKLIKDDMLYHIYKITNKINNKIYVGFHKTDNINDGYMGSGKLIIKAIEKYGIDNFTKEILYSFDTKEEAEKCEAAIVDKHFTLREDTCNIAIGGNVRIMYGENNGFFGKTHTRESKEKMGLAHIGNIPSHAHEFLINDSLIKGMENAAIALGITENIRNNVVYECGNPDSDISFTDQAKQEAAIKYFIRKNEVKITNSKTRSAACRKRFLGVVKSKKTRKKISDALKGMKRQNLHNKDPEKIKKTATAHRGMKRSEEAKSNMSKARAGCVAKNKGKKFFTNPNDITQRGYFVIGEQPHDWVNKTKI